MKLTAVHAFISGVRGTSGNAVVMDTMGGVPRRLLTLIAARTSASTTNADANLTGTTLPLFWSHRAAKVHRITTGTGIVTTGIGRSTVHVYATTTAMNYAYEELSIRRTGRKNNAQICLYVSLIPM